MNAQNFVLASGLVSTSYMSQASEARRRRENLVRSLLANRQLPEEGWDEATVEMFLTEVSVMDTNNFVGNVGVGEREGRVWSPLVARRNYRLAHGIGRSGDVNAIQPKAAGSSLLLKLATCLTLHSLKLAGVPETKACLLLPMATGMAHVLTLLTLKAQRPHCTKVIWPRIDQKTCLKAIVSAGLQPLVVENVLDGDELVTDVERIAALLKEHGDQVLCVLTTNSCFAPRVPDRLVPVAKLCAEQDVFHVVNNAYGVQMEASMASLQSAKRKGRVDVYIQSTDKNYMVPVGGSVVAGFDAKFVDDISKFYPGRACMSPILDLFITLVSLGKSGWLNALKQRKDTYSYFLQRMQAFAPTVGERVLHTPGNTISIGMTIDSFDMGGKQGQSYLGAMLFSRCVSGPRTVPKGVKKEVAGISFTGYGSHTDTYPAAYLTVAAAMGMTREEVDVAMDRLGRCCTEFRKQKLKRDKKAARSERDKNQASDKCDQKQAVVDPDKQRTNGKCDTKQATHSVDQDNPQTNDKHDKKQAANQDNQRIVGQGSARGNDRPPQQPNDEQDQHKAMDEVHVMQTQRKEVAHLAQEHPCPSTTATQANTPPAIMSTARTQDVLLAHDAATVDTACTQPEMGGKGGEPVMGKRRTGKKRGKGKGKRKSSRKKRHPTTGSRASQK